MSESHGHETRDLNLRPVVLAGLGLLTLIAVLGPLGALLVHHYGAREARESPPASPLAGRQLPPEPRLQTEPRKDLARLRAEEDALLGGYAWVDRQAGTVRIPIVRAMELLAERRAGRRGR